jgi:hypothetical protein
MPASAAIVTWCGPTICYEFDDQQAAITDPVDSYGTPVLDGDSLVFTPNAFRAESSDIADTDTATANFVAKVYSLNGEDILQIAVTELIDYDIVNNGEVRADLRLTIVNSPDFDSNLATFQTSGDTGGQQLTILNGSIEPVESLSDSTELQLTMQNTLTTKTFSAEEGGALGDNAWIQKKVTLTATVVPIPAAVWLFGSGLVGLFVFGRRRMA